MSLDLPELTEALDALRDHHLSALLETMAGLIEAGADVEAEPWLRGPHGQPLRTAALRLPAQVIAGDADGSTPPDLVKEMAELIPGAQYDLIRGAGHLPCVEKPAEYADVLATFLKEIGHV